MKNSVTGEDGWCCAGAGEPTPIERTAAAERAVEIITAYEADKGRGSLYRLDLPPAGVARGFDPDSEGNDRLIAVRFGGELRVYRNDCPHQHRPMGWRKDRFLSADGHFLMCFAHGARFDIGSGRCVEGPCLGESLERVPHRVDAGGNLSVEASGRAAQR